MPSTWLNHLYSAKIPTLYQVDLCSEGYYYFSLQEYVGKRKEWKP